MGSFVAIDVRPLMTVLMTTPRVGWRMTLIRPWCAEPVNQPTTTRPPRELSDCEFGGVKIECSSNNRYAANASSSAFASFRSRVSNPSVNQP